MAIFKRLKEFPFAGPLLTLLNSRIARDVKVGNQKKYVYDPEVLLVYLWVCGKGRKQYEKEVRHSEVEVQRVCFYWVNCKA